MNPDLLPEGLQDRLMPQAEAMAALLQSYFAVFSGHGYERVAPPLIEFEASLAHRTKGYTKDRMLRAVDPISLRTLALRSDITVQVGRIATTRLAAAPRPLRLSYAGPVVTLRAGELHPERERMQIGAELIGNDTVAAASEIVGLAVEALKSAGAQQITVDFTLPDLVDTLAQQAFPLSEDDIVAVRRELDTKDAGGLKSLKADAYIPLLYAMGPLDSALQKLCAVDAGGALASRIKALEAIAAPLDPDVTVTLDPSERHGFEYQSWFGFSLYADGHSEVLGRGGTYAIATGEETQEVATGFTLYADRLIKLSDIQGNAKKVFLPVGHNRDAAAELRVKGWRTVAALSDSDDPSTLACSHILREGGLQAL